MTVFYQGWQRANVGGRNGDAQGEGFANDHGKAFEADGWEDQKFGIGQKFLGFFKG